MKKIILLLLGSSMLIYACKKDDSSSTETPAPTPSVSDKQKVIDDYNNNYLTSAVTDAELAWTGNTGNCAEGTISQVAQDRVIQRIQYFRRQVGYTETITLDASKNTVCQKGALIMKANNALSHTPPTTWSCYSQDAATSAGNSNISLGSHSSSSVSGQMQDNGTGNTAAGHRRWILYSGMKTVGHGSTDASSNLFVLHNFGNPKAASTPEFIAWPPKGYVVNALVFPRWSFGIPGADFTNATVAMTGPSGPVTLAQETVADGYGDNTVVWVPQVTSPIADDTKYTVTVNNVKVSGSAKSYTYDVTVVKP